VGPRASGGHGLFEGHHVVRLHQGAGRPLVAAAQHPLAQHARDGSGEIAHGFQFGTRDLVQVPQSEPVLAKDPTDRDHIAGLPRIQHALKALLSAEDVPQSVDVIWVGLAVLRLDGGELIRCPHVGQTGDAEFRTEEGSELVALRPSKPVGALLQTWTHRPGVETHDPEIERILAEGHVLDGAIRGVVVRPHARLGEQDHDLVELAAGRADVVVFHRLGEVDDAHRVLDVDVVGVQQRQDEVEGERR